MAVHFRLSVAGLAVSLGLPAQTLSNPSLNGKYFFREVLLTTDTSQVQTLYGSVIFDGKGGYTLTAQLLSGSSAPTNSGGTNGTYTVQSGGLVTISDPLRSGGTVNARLGNGIVIGSNTEAGNNVFSIFVAVAAPSSSVGDHIMSGTYWIASLEMLNGNLAFTRETLFQTVANGNGSFGSPQVTGEAVNLGNKRMSQTVSGATYFINADGAGEFSLPFPSSNPSALLLGGTRTIYAAGDGSFFVGGSASAGGQGIVVGIRAGTNLSNASVTKLYWTADLLIRGQSDASSTGSAVGLGNGTMTATKRLRQNGGSTDVTTVNDYSVASDGSGSLLDNNIAVSADGQLFVGSGLTTLDTDRYELFMGVRAPDVSGTGMFLNPQGVVNVFSFAPAGNPIAPGEFITIFGTGLPPRNAVSVPFPAALNGVQLLINGTPAPLYLITSTQVFAVVPYSVTGSTATIVLSNAGAQSNTITVPLAATSPGVASVTQNGIGAAAVTHANGQLISASSPALRGETVVLYLTGLGAVSPSVPDGSAAPSNPFSRTTSVLTIYLNGVCPNSPNCNASNISYQGLAPGFAGLYQVNFQIPLTAASGSAVPLAIQTTNGFADMVEIAIQ